MQLITFAAALFAAAAVANPVNIEARTDVTTTGGKGGGGGGYDACSAAVYSNLQCCGVDILGVANLDCESPSFVPTSAKSFATGCAAGGKTARCCALPLLGQALLCVTPVGL